ncbi:hypothetical protein [Haemophilus influenzae]|uniref:hypothetical protein n=1 Tax=Haemophilus influenzae TaxID=727 RepID=UPI0010A54EFB|nr:hypothetical protein [Haemophilus influenzae]MCK9009683.1 hypothetical protein [Haemophilus influenzae]MCK9011373.1 hypothetical protein [Haemophilus influenzae]MCK9060097.1 hypothetical protein [Haemophilus influenzae]
MNDNSSNMSLLNLLNDMNQTQVKLQNRILGLEMCVKGMALLYILDGGDISDKRRKAEMLKNTLASLQQGLMNDPIMEGLDKDSFFSSAKGIISSIEDIILQLDKLSEGKNE